MSWVTKLVGVGSMLDAIDDLKINIEGDTVYIVGTNVKYSVYVEMGTSNMAAQPYFRPAVREAERKIPQFAEQSRSTDELVKRIALFIERRAAELAPVDSGNLHNSIKTVRVR